MKWFFYYLSKLSGWKFQIDIPAQVTQFVLIAAPHTSNWDFKSAMSFFYKSRRKINFAIKIEWIESKLGWLMKSLGAIGIDRHSKTHNNLTEQLASLFKNPIFEALAIAPEGTRSRVDKWKTGFYYIAQKAEVPIVIAYADYKNKIIGTGPVIYPKNFEEDMKKIMAFYKNISAHTPENFSLDVRYL